MLPFILWIHIKLSPSTIPLKHLKKTWKLLCCFITCEKDSVISFFYLNASNHLLKRIHRHWRSSCITFLEYREQLTVGTCLKKCPIPSSRIYICLSMSRDIFTFLLTHSESDNVLHYVDHLRDMILLENTPIFYLIFRREHSGF